MTNELTITPQRQRCNNFPCAKYAGHDGPCSTSPDSRSSKELVIGDTALLPDETIRRMTLDAGGTFHGPRVEHASIEEQAYFRLMRQAFELGRRSTRRTANEPPDVPSVEPIARVINNNQPGWTNIVETAPNVTLDVGAPLYSRESVMRLAAALAGAIDRAAQPPCPDDVREALKDANEMCRAAYQVAKRVVEQYGKVKMGVNFDALHKRLDESLKLQHRVMLDREMFSPAPTKSGEQA